MKAAASTERIVAKSYGDHVGRGGYEWCVIGPQRLRLGFAHIPVAPFLGNEPPQWFKTLAYAYGTAGRRDQVEKLASEAPLAHPHTHGPFQYALVYAGLRDKDRTIDQLERWTGVGPVRIGFTLAAPEFAFVRADPRVKVLRKKIGLPE
jgi:hypothetical protein